jgi:hypothetical protein
MSKRISHPFIVLQALWRLTQRGIPADLERLAAECSLPPSSVQGHLEALHAADLADAQRVRLTLQGLAQAVALSSLSLRGVKREGQSVVCRQR